MSGKQLPPPAGGPDLTELLRKRHANTDDSAPASQPAPQAPLPRPSRARPKTPAMDRRSWYMPKISADALADAVEELHYATRQPKHVVMQALVDTVLRHLDEAQAHIEHRI